MDPLKLLQDLVSIPGPPGHEDAVREYLERAVSDRGLTAASDAKGNLHVKFGSSERPKVVVTAHMDEIAMIVRQVNDDGTLRVANIGGLHPWKLGEGSVLILGDKESVPGIFSFGSIHTEHKDSARVKAQTSAIDWTWTTIQTGLSAEQLRLHGVRPGTRVVVHPTRRDLFPMGDLVCGYFLDDRADLVAWLLALDILQVDGADALFIATVSEEVGGQGALYALQDLRPEVCIALELGPIVADAPVSLSPSPTVWVTDGYAATTQSDGALISEVAAREGLEVQFQALSRGGSDASIAASQGLCARPITLGIPMENSHGYEIIHKDSMAKLAKLTAALVQAL